MCFVFVNQPDQKERDDDISFEEQLEALNEVVKAGKVGDGSGGTLRVLVILEVVVLMVLTCCCGGVSVVSMEVACHSSCAVCGAST